MSVYNDIMMIVGTIVSLGFIGTFVWYINKHIGDYYKTKEWLTKYVSILLAALVGLFIVDKVIGVKVQLLSEEMSDGLFELIKNVVLIVFGYQFGGKINNDRSYRE